MNILNIFGRKQESPKEEAAAPPASCPHVILTPRWDSAADVGHEDRAVGYKCSSCGASLTLEEGMEARRRHIAPSA